MLNVMHSKADDIKIVAKLGKGESLPFWSNASVYVSNAHVCHMMLLIVVL